MTYQIINDDYILHVEDNLSIPKDERNADYQQYQAWLKEGNTPLPAPAPPEPPPAPVLTLAEKLAAAGITLDELKKALLAS